MIRTLTLTILSALTIATATHASDHKSHSTNTQHSAKVDIVDTAIKAGSFSTLVAAVQAASLEETLRGDGPFTIFAPTDEAFAKLPAGTVATLIKPENKEKLRQILTYHVVPGKILSGDIAGKSFFRKKQSMVLSSASMR